MYLVVWIGDISVKKWIKPGQVSCRTALPETKPTSIPGSGLGAGQDKMHDDAHQPHHHGLRTF